MRSSREYFVAQGLRRVTHTYYYFKDMKELDGLARKPTASMSCVTFWLDERQADQHYVTTMDPSDLTFIMSAVNDTANITAVVVTTITITTTPYRVHDALAASTRIVEAGKYRTYKVAVKYDSEGQVKESRCMRARVVPRSMKEMVNNFSGQR
ncbi:uncharacterized protein B0T15DRAFT_506371 [Chaetomium strumarium]|uniref:Thioesterase domain-containing protein n=1 Tax=Chaetomium strumarium TaxID=1170767 RepID=A0AAJ0M5J9_9PEZI|nr:hypothetical protein B0T15DRAFT_506371 [Chaetomium strumarium]